MLTMSHTTYDYNEATPRANKPADEKDILIRALKGKLNK